MRKNLSLSVVISLLLGIGCVDGLWAQTQMAKKPLENPDLWTLDRGNRMRDELPYLKDPNPQTRIRVPLKSKIVRDVLIIGDDLRGDLLRMERIKDYVLVDVHTFADPGYRGRIVAGGPRFSTKGITLFYGDKRARGDYFLYDEIRAFHDPSHDFYPMVVIRFYAPDQGVVYLDFTGSGEPQAIVNFSSVPVKK